MKCFTSSSADKQTSTIRTLQNKNSAGFGVSLVCILLQNRANTHFTSSIAPVMKVIYRFRFCKSQGRGAKNFYAEGDKVGKKAGNTHISQDGGKYWYFPGITGNSRELLGNKLLTN